MGRSRSSRQSAWGGGPEPRIERLVNVMFLENICRDERQVVDVLSELGGHASRSNGHGANSGDGGRNFPGATGLTGFLVGRRPVSVGRYIICSVQCSERRP